ncbi:MAG: alpha/beta hydrolase [Myxococcales bacterium]|jgi:pimeloyl-ACP methyl ester carboxylesterase|nr:alpha/beta hydrolase [Myxococcales bacterium]
MRAYTEDFVTTDDGANIWHALLGELGEGDVPIVLCDGLGCCGFAWKHILPRLVAQHPIVRWNYRGHGRSTLARDPRAVGVEHAACDLAKVLDARGIDRVILAGHSMGTQVILEFHRRFPERVLALIPICGAYGYPLDTFHDTTLLKKVFPHLLSAAERFPWLSRKITGAIMPSELAYQIACWFEVNRHLIHREDFEPYFTHLAHMDPLDFLHTLEAAATHTAWEHLPNVRVPTLIVAADSDTFTPYRISEKMHELIEGSELVTVFSGSHAAVIEQPELIALRIERFLRERGVWVARAA